MSLQLGRWARLDVQMLVEEHARGRVLMRVARRLRVTPFFGVTMLSLIALGSALATNMSGRWLIAAPIVIVVGLMLRACWNAAATVALADDVMTRVMLEAGATPLGERAVAIADRLMARRRLSDALIPHISAPTPHAD